MRIDGHIHTHIHPHHHLTAEALFPLEQSQGLNPIKAIRQHASHSRGFSSNQPYCMIGCGRMQELGSQTVGMNAT